MHFALENPEHYRVVMMQAHDPAQESMVQECIEIGVLVGEPLELALALWAAAHGVAALLVAKPYFPWPDLDAFIDRTICMAGLGLAAGARLDPAAQLPELKERLDRLRG